MNPETADEACEVKNQPLSSVNSAEKKESECIACGYDSMEKVFLFTVIDCNYPILNEIWCSLSLCYFYVLDSILESSCWVTASTI